MCLAIKLFILEEFGKTPKASSILIVPLSKPPVPPNAVLPLNINSADRLTVGFIDYERQTVKFFV
jgi:hypothetical protein